jgi:hypothetical protein
MKLTDIETRVLAAALRCRSLVPDETLKDLQELIESGEPGIATENLCTQLVEYDAKVPDELIAELQSLCREMGLADKYWRRLEEPH